NLVTLLEILDIGRAPIDWPQVRHVTQLLGPHVTGRFERVRGQTLRRPAHEVGPDRQRDARARAACANPLRLVVANPDTCDDGGVEADEPGVAIVVCRARLPADGAVYAERPRGRAGTTID